MDGSGAVSFFHSDIFRTLLELIPPTMKPFLNSPCVLSLLATFVLFSRLPCLADECATLVADGGSAGGYSSAIILDVGDTATLAAISGIKSGAAGSTIVEVVVGGFTFNETPWYFAGSTGETTLKPIKIAGPATIRVGVPTGSAVQAWGTFNITRAAALQNAVPTNAVVIPENASGQFQVILESSTDLITWTAVNPGNYGGTTQKRFFRTRIVQTN